MKTAIIELTVRNHPGVMSHITGLFSRRAYNLEGIFVNRLKNTEKSRMLLAVEENEKISQIIKQLEKLHDVLEVSLRHDEKEELIRKMDEFLT
ncbi:MAG TPA: acetolactate synthase small subunit [Spirochaetia bacterium]|nr:MAG: acetolactate synthase small subunit [Spirochaetes bacterium GWB1_36_13]HCL56363.1 acetolactate synthase small subunit [Spirochaetia bacterium]